MGREAGLIVETHRPDAVYHTKIDATPAVIAIPNTKRALAKDLEPHPAIRLDRRPQHRRARTSPGGRRPRNRRRQSSCRNLPGQRHLVYLCNGPHLEPIQHPGKAHRHVKGQPPVEGQFHFGAGVFDGQGPPVAVEGHDEQAEFLHGPLRRQVQQTGELDLNPATPARDELGLQRGDGQG